MRELLFLLGLMPPVPVALWFLGGDPFEHTANSCAVRTNRVDARLTDV
jgi:hypothetical protein